MGSFPTCLLLTFSLCLLSGVYCNCDLMCIDEPVKVKMVYTMLQSDTLWCNEWSHGPEVTYTWYKLFPGIGYQPATRDPTVTIGDQGASLSFHSFTIDVDKDEYKCKIGNYRDNNRAKIWRLRRRSLIGTNWGEGQITYKIPEFSYLFMACTFQGEINVEDIQFSWTKFKDGQFIPLPDNPDRLYIDVSGNLHFTPVLNMDENIIGNFPYHSFLWSPSGSAGVYGSKAFINVTKRKPTWDKPQLKYKSNDVVTEKFGKATLECVFEDNGLLGTSIYWIRPDNKILSNRHPEKYKLLFQSKRLVVLDVRECDQGTYYCEARNALGTSDRHPINIRMYCRDY